MITDEHKAKAKEIRELIKAQPPEVLVWLSDFCGLDDGEPMTNENLDEAIDQMFDYHGYPADTKELLKQRVQLGASLPDVFVDIKIVADEDGEEGDNKHVWEFSKP